MRRKQRSAYNTLLTELHTEDPNEFRNYYRIDKTTFKMLLEKVRPLIETGYQTSGRHICGLSTDKAKYHTAIEKNGFILTILNLTVKDLNVSYECSCGFDLDKHILYIKDVYTGKCNNKT
jgi:hypothetical protein